MIVKLPSSCPSCGNRLSVTELQCGTCETKVSGNFPLPVILQLSPEEQGFLLSFFLESGSLKNMAKKMDISYPTVRNYLDDLIEKIQKLKENEK